MIPKDYTDELKKGYFNERGVIKKVFIKELSEKAAKSFLGPPQMTSTQLRNFYNHVKSSGTIYQLSRQDRDTAKDELLIKVQRLDSIVGYNKGRDGINIPVSFVEFIKANLEACKSADDVIAGFIPHFETVVGYFKLAEKEAALANRQSNRNQTGGFRR